MRLTAFSSCTWCAHVAPDLYGARAQDMCSSENVSRPFRQNKNLTAHRISLSFLKTRTYLRRSAPIHTKANQILMKSSQSADMIVPAGRWSFTISQMVIHSTKRAMYTMYFFAMFSSLNIFVQSSLLLIFFFFSDAPHGRAIPRVRGAAEYPSSLARHDPVRNFHRDQLVANLQDLFSSLKTFSDIEASKVSMK